MGHQTQNANQWQSPTLVQLPNEIEYKIDRWKIS